MALPTFDQPALCSPLRQPRQMLAAPTDGGHKPMRGATLKAADAPHHALVRAPVLAPGKPCMAGAA